MLQNSNASLSFLDICHEPRCCPCDLYLSLKEKTRTHLYIYICIDQTESIIWILIKRMKKLNIAQTVPLKTISPFILIKIKYDLNVYSIDYLKKYY